MAGTRRLSARGAARGRPVSTTPTPETIPALPVEPAVDRWIDAFMRLRPRSFSGSADPAVADDWMAHMLELFDALGCPFGRRVVLAALVLEGEAATWWRGQRRAMFGEAQNSEIAWDDFVEAFRECYIPASAMAQFRRELIHLRQGQMSVNDYLSRFTYLAVRRRAGAF
ncbi:hypothetical protein HPP92_007126 [Vanilla planifolia]|uniref:Retrotransposon gag domain-containing protein n=1 Tax=Vanilla planifolia TaxID=51239 RepID=A0A835R9W5_VANPL|nr:hypothetical protein HPP92_007126 [Vanilla planifolia]